MYSKEKINSHVKIYWVYLFTLKMSRYSVSDMLEVWVVDVILEKYLVLKGVQGLYDISYLSVVTAETMHIAII